MELTQWQALWCHTALVTLAVRMGRLASLAWYLHCPVDKHLFIQGLEGGKGHPPAQHIIEKERGELLNNQRGRKEAKARIEAMTPLNCGDVPGRNSWLGNASAGNRMIYS